MALFRDADALGLEDPFDDVSRRSTIPPAYDVEQHAKDLEAEPPSARPTSPPPPAFPLLRDSCASIHVGPALDEEGYSMPEIPVDEAESEDAARVPYVTLSASELRFLAFDDELTALVTAIDGATSIRGLAALCALPIGRAVALVDRLVARGVARVR